MAGSGRLSVDCGTKTLLLLQDLVKYYTDNSLKPSFPDLDTKLLYPFKQAAERKSSTIVSDVSFRDRCTCTPICSEVLGPTGRSYTLLR